MANESKPGGRRLGATRANSWRVDDHHANLVRPARPPRPLSFKAMPQNVTIDLVRSAMIVIDMQNDFCSEGGWFAERGIDIAPVRRPIDPLNGLLPALRREGAQWYAGPLAGGIRQKALPHAWWRSWLGRADRQQKRDKAREVYEGRNCRAPSACATAKRGGRVSRRN